MRQSLSALVVASGLALTACATGPVYKPAERAGGLGYSEQIIESNRFHISFKGSSSTPKKTVEAYLLHRAAEITLQNDYDYFTVVERDTESQSKLYPSAFAGHASRYGFGYSYFHPRGGWYGRYDPFWDAPTYREITKYEAFAEIILHKGEKPADETLAFDARDVIANVGATIQRPE